MKLITPTAEQNQLLSAWLNKRLGGGATECQCFAVMDGEKLVGVVKYFNYRWPNIEMAFLCEDYRWALNRDGILKAFIYPFVQLKCHRVTAIIERKNKVARKMVQRLGFKEEGMLRKAGPKGDMFVYGLLPEDLKLRKYHGQPIAATGT
jgi:RimJ/RimL family protein N-acetyltransferase